MGISKRIYFKTKTYKDLYYLQSLSLQYYRNFCYCLDMTKIQKRIPKGDHLLKGCEYWQKNMTIFSPEGS